MAVTVNIDASTNKDLFKVGTLRNIFDTTLKAEPMYSEELYNTKPTKLLTVRDQAMGSFEPATEHAEGQNINVQDPAVGLQKEYTQRFFGTGFRMTFVANRYNQYNLWSRWAKGISKAQKQAKDIELAVPFNSPDSTSLTCGVGFDTLALAHNTHTGLLAGSTADNFNNYLNSALAYSSLQSARYYFRTLTNDMGQLLVLEPTHLVYEPTLWPTVREMFGSDKKAWESSNTMNIASEVGVKPYEYPRLTSTTRWFMIAKGEYYDINMFTGMAPNFVVKDAPDRTLDKMCLTEQHFTYGWGDARAFYLGI
jgi:hypothetical protein